MFEASDLSSRYSALKKRSVQSPSGIRLPVRLRVRDKRTAGMSQSRRCHHVSKHKNKLELFQHRALGQHKGQVLHAGVADLVEGQAAKCIDEYHRRKRRGTGGGVERKQGKRRRKETNLSFCSFLFCLPTALQSFSMCADLRLFPEMLQIGAWGKSLIDHVHLPPLPPPPAPGSNLRAVSGECALSITATNGERVWMLTFASLHSE